MDAPENNMDMSDNKPTTEEIMNDINSAIEDPAMLELKLQTIVDKENSMDILGNSQLLRRVIKKGEPGTRPDRGDLCVINIIGQLENGKIVDVHKNKLVQLGDFEVTMGLDLALALMDVGEIALIYVHPRFAYSEQGTEDIPSNSVITYIIELKKVTRTPEIETLSLKKRMNIGIVKCERAIFWRDNKEWICAAHCFRRALEYLKTIFHSLSGSVDTDSEISDIEVMVAVAKTKDIHKDDESIDLPKLSHLCWKCYYELSDVLVQMQSFSAALEAIENARRLQPTSVLTLCRKGLVLKEMGRYDEAYSAMRDAQNLDVKNDKPHFTVSMKNEMNTIKVRLDQDKKKEKQMYRKMLGFSDKDSNKQKKDVVTCTTKPPKNKKKESTSKNFAWIHRIWTMLWYLVGGIAVAIISILVHKYIDIRP